MNTKLERESGVLGNDESVRGALPVSRQLRANSMVDDDPLWELKIQRRTLEAASRIRSEFSRLQAELLQAHDEVGRLRKEVRVLRACQTKLAGIDTSGIRRHAARRLHPDRGGDAVLMTKINTVLDELELMQALFDQEANLAA